VCVLILSNSGYKRNSVTYTCSANGVWNPENNTSLVCERNIFALIHLQNLFYKTFLEKGQNGHFGFSAQVTLLTIRVTILPWENLKKSKF
jgi:hypothetical protein